MLTYHKDKIRFLPNFETPVDLVGEVCCLLITGSSIYDVSVPQERMFGSYGTPNVKNKEIINTDHNVRQAMLVNKNMFKLRK